MTGEACMANYEPYCTARFTPDIDLHNENTNPTSLSRADLCTLTSAADDIRKTASRVPVPAAFVEHVELSNFRTHRRRPRKPPDWERKSPW